MYTRTCNPSLRNICIAANQCEAVRLSACHGYIVAKRYDVAQSAIVLSHRAMSASYEMTIIIRQPSAAVWQQFLLVTIRLLVSDRNAL